MTTAPLELDNVRFPYVSADTVWASPLYSIVLVNASEREAKLAGKVPVPPIRRVAPFATLTAHQLLLYLCLLKSERFRIPLLTTIIPEVLVCSSHRVKITRQRFYQRTADAERRISEIIPDGLIDVVALYSTVLPAARYWYR
ncbi:hypothetical protein [Chitinophaga pinensis]|uniref:hypothetical protein n=1 Tax=Chitinophaga pinensis TaxID=79329 RepID=UPI001C9A0294|nr:hypothetical protein [Chitinophaga pinensis]